MKSVEDRVGSMEERIEETEMRAAFSEPRPPGHLELEGQKALEAGRQG